MCSAQKAPDAPADDRTAKARIRDAAINCFAEYGIAGTTARRVAAAAGVSAGLVIHHFESMDGLRSACDEHVVAVIRQQKHAAISAGPGFDVLAALRDSEIGSLASYLARVLVDDSPAVATLVDNLVADAEGYIQQGVAAGTVRPSADPRGRAAVLSLWSLGALVLHQHTFRLLGVDLTDPEIGSDPALAAYAGPAWEILGEGFFTEAFAAQLKDAFSATSRDGDVTDQATPPTEPAAEPTSKEPS